MPSRTILATLLLVVGSHAFSDQKYYPSSPRTPLVQRGSSVSAASIESVCQNFNQAFQACQDEVAKTANVKIGNSPASGRLGLLATKSIKKGDVVLAMPYDDRFMLTADIARNVVFKDKLPDKFEGWTGDAGILALLILNEMARADNDKNNKGVQMPERSDVLQAFMAAWVAALPSPAEMKELHPLLWPEGEQEILQLSSTNKVYRVLDDIEEDAVWFTERLFSDRESFPETVTCNGETRPCFCLEGFRWAVALAQSRSAFLDGSLRILPVMDLCNHFDDAAEIKGGYMGTFGTTQGAKIVASQSYNAGDEVFCSYGPKSAADYLLEHGFCPPQSWKAAVSELTFEIDQDDRFYDDKLDILEYETYDQAPMNPVQSFDVISAPGRDGEPDPAMVQFVRLCKLGATDAFLLESIFRNEVWGFMSMPVSEANELKVVNAISEACQKAIDDLAQCPEGGPEVCKKLRESETRALSRTLAYLQREKEALDLKEYYQERRLKDLGLDSDWSPEDEGPTRTPGGADYDW
jgi:[ribulose-bisphosphate carboxylase]/[fructose-bisphosphate aldolase]-lysine N-methyltransferase